MTTTVNLLGQVQESLAYAQYPNVLRPAQADLPVPHLLVGPGSYMTGPGTYDPERRTWLLFFSLNALRQAKGQSQALTDTLQCLIQLPIELAAGQEAALCQVINGFNLMLPLGEFGLDVAGRVGFRYGWRYTPETLDGLTLLEIVETLLFYVENIGYRLEAVAQGRQSAEAVLAEPFAYQVG